MHNTDWAGHFCKVWNENKTEYLVGIIIHDKKHARDIDNQIPDWDPFNEGYVAVFFLGYPILPQEKKCPCIISWKYPMYIVHEHHVTIMDPQFNIIQPEIGDAVYSIQDGKFCIVVNSWNKELLKKNAIDPSYAGYVLIFQDESMIEQGYKQHTTVYRLRQDFYLLKWPQKIHKDAQRNRLQNIFKKES